jgi:hypothetical protein
LGGADGFLDGGELCIRPIELVFVDQHPLLLVRPHYLRVS